jgi:glycosyltransferase involved in cell wall biosynthesis
MNLLALVDTPDHVCCRYRIRAYAQPLQEAGWSLTCQPLARGAIARTIQLRGAARYDAVVLQRKLLPGWQFRILRQAARHLVFDFDDAILYRDSYDPRGPESGRRRRRFALAVRSVDTVVAGNDFLADCALRAGARVENVHVIPTCLDPNLYPIARPESPEGPVGLVWIGTSSTLRGLEQARGIWSALSSALPDLRLRIICDRFPEGFPMPLVAIPWEEASEASQLAAGQIGVSWLPDDLWSRGKCGLKVLQYQAAGLPVLANPVGCQCEMVRSGENGILAATPAEWVAAAALLARDPALRRRMGDAGRCRVETDYSVSAWGETFVSSMTGGSRRLTGPVRRADRPESEGGRPIFESHTARLKPVPSLNPVGKP